MYEVIAKECAKQTVIAVAHRLHHIDYFDRVMVLHHGELVEFDSPHALLERESAFKRLHDALER